MDRSWVSIKNRTCKEYENGVEAFLRFALEHGCDSTRMICPCKDCCYSRLINVDEVREHLIYRGIISDYTRWIWHGEKSVATHSTASEEFVHGTNFDVLEDYDDRLNDMIDDIEGDLANDPDKFLDMVNNAKMPLYSGCTRFTKLSALLKLYNLKARHGWSDSSFGDMLELIKEILPKDNSLPVSTYEAKKILRSTGMNYERKHACINDCVLYRNEHPGRVRGVGGDVNISHYFGHASRHGSTSRVLEQEEVINEATKRLKESMQAQIESMFNAEREATKQVIQTLIEERKQYLPDKPLPKMPSFNLGTIETEVPRSVKGSCSTIKDSTFSQKSDGTTPCRLFWPTMDKEVAEGIVYHSCSGVVMLHNRPLKSGLVKVSIIKPLEAAKEVEVPFPTDEAHTMLDATGQFIAWPEHLVLTIESTTCLKENEIRNSAIKEYASSKDIDPTPSILEDFRWMLDEFVESPLRYVKIPKSLFNIDHSDVSIGMEQVQIWLDKKELDMCHVSIYLRYLFETRCKGVDDIFGFLSPTLVSPHANSGSLKDRATYIANSMKGNIENKLFFAPYKIGPRWVLLVLNPHYGYAYWIDPAQKGQELDADKLVDLSFTFKFMDLQKKKPRKQILWHIVKCPQHQNVIDSGYYVLRFIKEIMRRNSISVPKIWYGKKESLSESEIDEIRKEWIEYLLQLMF